MQPSIYGRFAKNTTSVFHTFGISDTISTSERSCRKESWSSPQIILGIMLGKGNAQCSQRKRTLKPILGGGFKYFLIFTPTWGNDPIWLAHIFKRVGSTTNQNSRLKWNYIPGWHPNFTSWGLVFFLGVCFEVPTTSSGGGPIDVYGYSHQCHPSNILKHSRWRYHYIIYIYIHIYIIFFGSGWRFLFSRTSRQMHWIFSRWLLSYTCRSWALYLATNHWSYFPHWNSPAE